MQYDLNQQEFALLFSYYFKRKSGYFNLDSKFFLSSNIDYEECVERLDSLKQIKANQMRNTFLSSWWKDNE